MKFNPSLFLQEPVLGILRGVTRSSLEGVLQAARDADLKFLEITLNTDNALDLIPAAVEQCRDSLCIGAGTVCSLDDARQAMAAGAAFLVGPTLNAEVAAYCLAEKIAYFPGALTPTEIEKAWQAGAHMVKVFPASQWGPDYFKEIQGPFPDIPLMAVGGVRADNIPTFMGQGASAVAVGGSVFSVSRMVNGEYSKIHNHLKEIMFAVKNFLHTMK